MTKLHKKCDRHHSKTIPNVIVVNGKATRLDVDFKTTSIAVARRTALNQIRLVKEADGIRIIWDNSIGHPELELYTVDGVLLSKISTQSLSTNSFVWGRNNRRTDSANFYIIKMTLNNIVYTQKCILT